MIFLPMKVLLLILLVWKCSLCSASINSPDEVVKMERNIFKYVKMIINMSPLDRQRLLTNNIPKSLEEALDLVVREVLVYQNIYLEQISALETFKKDPKDWEFIASYIAKLGGSPSEFYNDASYHVAWCNTLIRYVGWIARNPEKGRIHVERLFKMLYTMHRKHFNSEYEGLRPLLNRFPDIKSMDVWTISWLLFKLRLDHFDPPSKLPQTMWFHDCWAPTFILYTRASRILLPFIDKPTAIRMVSDLENASTYPFKFNLLYQVATTKMKQIAGSIKAASFKDIRNAWSVCSNRDAFRIIKDLDDVGVNDLDFEKSYINPLDLEDLDVSSIAKSVLRELKQEEMEKKQMEQKETEKQLKKQEKNRKKNQKKRQKKMGLVNESSSTTLFKPEPVEASESRSSDIETSSKDDKATLNESGPSVLTKLEDDASVSESSSINITTLSITSGPVALDRTSIGSCSNPREEEHAIKAPLDSTETITSEKAECRGEEGIEDWAAKLERERELYALQEKELAQAQKFIRQQKTAQKKSALHAQVRQNLKWSSSSKSSFRTLLDSTELRLAYPEASALYLANENICSSKASRFQWIFDTNVVIKQKHMKFLCVLFNLKKGKGQLSFLDMAKAFWAIEKCFRKGREGKDLRRTVFQWSHQFEINSTLVSPVKKGIHPEHDSSGFNHHQAIDLFDGGGFDPRFFRAMQ
jgi:hypothetical protein